MRGGLVDIFERNDVPVSVTGVGSTFGIHFQREKPVNAGDTARNDIPATRAYFRHMLESGIIYLSPTVSHSWISSPHTEKDIEGYLSATEEYIRTYKP
jgi:glutamate-1-semialdehyde aminotransferase